MQSYYVDSCIYLNLWRKEVAFDGFKFWKIAEDFFKFVDGNNAIVYYSGYLLKELSFLLDDSEINKKILLFKKSSNFKKISLSLEDYELARKIEVKIDYELGFFDIIHMLLARKNDSILITRDRKLIEISERYNVKVAKPEELL